MPRIVVLLATFNGRRWLPAQLSSILGQEGVDVSIIALDDGSTDGTMEWLHATAAEEPRLTILDSTGPSGSAAANFYRLLLCAPVDGADFIGLADQDDVWRPNKLAIQVELAQTFGYEGVSSSVMSFDRDGRRTLIRKDFPQRRFDYLFESPGPGCTFLMTPGLLSLVRAVLESDRTTAMVDFHDSLIYAIARGHGDRWHIDGFPSVEYRQHDDNVMGANVGASSAMARLSLIRNRWHRGQALAMSKIVLPLTSPEEAPEVENMIRLLESKSLASRFALARRSWDFRRRPRDRIILGWLIALGIW